jgi:DsbC/DsbD-like thiol-disulfide interchange protein
VALQVLQKLWRRTGSLLYRQQAQELIGRFTPSLEELPHSYGYMLTAILDQTSGELNAQGYAAQGGIRVQADLTVVEEGSKTLRVELKIPDGWHINSDQPGHADLIGTRISLDKESGWELDSIHYPQGQAIKLGFQQEPISLYTGQVSILARLDPPAAVPATLTLPVQVRLQACNDQVCLPPEEVTLRVALP